MILLSKMVIAAATTGIAFLLISVVGGTPASFEAMSTATLATESCVPAAATATKGANIKRESAPVVSMNVLNKEATGNNPTDIVPAMAFITNAAEHPATNMGIDEVVSVVNLSIKMAKPPTAPKPLAKTPPAIGIHTKLPNASPMPLKNTMMSSFTPLSDFFLIISNNMANKMHMRYTVATSTLRPGNIAPLKRITTKNGNIGNIT